MILNRINGAEANCIIVSLSKDVEESFISNNRKSLNAKVWLGLGNKREWKTQHTLLDKMKKFFSEK